MEEAGQTGQESSAPAWKINHRRGAGGKDGRTEEKENCGGLQASGPPPPPTQRSHLLDPCRRVGGGVGTLCKDEMKRASIFAFSRLKNFICRVLVLDSQ